MREILFRAKRTYKDEWVYGNLIYDMHDQPHIIEKKYFYEDEHHLKYDNDTDIPVFIDPNTIGQYTGIKDLNGTLIFEGDIVKQKYHGKGVVKFSTELGSCGCCYPQFSGSGFWAVSIDLSESEVIGNIYDKVDKEK